MKRPENLALIIFGASGDLTYRKLIPAVYSLKVQGLLPEKFEIIGVSRSKMSDIDFRKKIKEGIISFSGEKNISEKDIDEFTYHLSYFTIDLDSEKDFGDLKKLLIKKDNECRTAGNYVFYLATPPSMYTTIAENLSVSGLSDQTGGFRRIIFEKPFGYDLYSCQQLNARLHKLFTEATDLSHRSLPWKGNCSESAGNKVFKWTF